VTRQELVDMYQGYLMEQGFRPEVLDGRLVTFMSEGGKYAILVDENDAGYFRLIFPNFWSIRDEAERIRVLKAADYATAETKVAKVFTVRDNVWAAIEAFPASPEQFKATFPRSMDALRLSVRKFLERVGAS